MMRRNWLLAAALVLLIAGCGGGGGGGGGGGVTLSGTVYDIATGNAPNPPVTVLAGGSSAKSGASDGTFSMSVPSGTASLTLSQTVPTAWTVTASSMDFQPQNLSITAGDTVVWHNNDTVSHWVQSGTNYTPDGVFDTGTIAPGKASSPISFNTAGTYSYYCEIHKSGMVHGNLYSVSVKAGGAASFVYTFAPVTSATNVGVLYVGQESVTVQGHVIDAETFQAIAGATVTALGHTTTTASDGTYSFTNMPWDETAFIQPEPVAASKDGYAQSSTPYDEGTLQSGTVTMKDIVLAPTSSSTPPGLPHTIWGMITEANGGGGILVEADRQSDGKQSFFRTGDPNSGLPTNEYLFWVGVGTYTLKFYDQKNNLKTTVNVTVVSTDKPVRQDVSW